MEIELGASSVDGPERPLKASVMSSFINLANTAVGGGMLGLPFAYSHTGYFLGTILTLFCAAAAAFSLHLLSLCALKQQGPSSFYSLATDALPRFTGLIDIAVATNCFGAASSFLVIIGRIMPQVMQQFGASHSLQARELWVVVGFAIVAPLTCLRRLDSLKFTSYFGVGFVIFLTSLIVLYAANINSLDPCVDIDTEAGDVCKGDTSNVQFSFQTGQTISVIVFAFSCQQNIFAIINELERPTMVRIDQVIVSSIVLISVIYVVVSCCGYYTYGGNVKPDILVNYPTNIVTSLARISVALLVAFSYPLQAHPARMCLLTLVSSIVDKSHRQPARQLFAAPRREYNGVQVQEEEEEEEEEEDVEASEVARNTKNNDTTSHKIGVEVDGDVLNIIHEHNVEKIKDDLDEICLHDADQNGDKIRISNQHKLHTKARSDHVNGNNSNINSSINSNSRNSIYRDKSSGNTNACTDSAACAGGVHVAEGSMMEPRFAIVTVVFLVLSLVVGLTVTNLSTVQGLSGATGSNAISFILPGFFYFNMFSDEEGPVWKRYAALTLGVIGLIMVPLFVIFMFL